MPSISFTGNDSIVWTDRDNPGGVPLTDFGDGDVLTITWGADISSTRVGKNGNVINARNAEGDLADVVLRLLRASDDDVMVNADEADYLHNPPGFITPTITATKMVGDGQGNIRRDTYAIAFITPKRHVDMKENVSGDTEQAIAVHPFTGISNPNNSPRTIG